jgi:hypothetical protein
MKWFRWDKTENNRVVQRQSEVTVSLRNTPEKFVLLEIVPNPKLEQE